MKKSFPYHPDAYQRYQSEGRYEICYFLNSHLSGS